MVISKRIEADIMTCEGVSYSHGVACMHCGRKKMEDDPVNDPKISKLKCLKMTE